MTPVDEGHAPDARGESYAGDGLDTRRGVADQIAAEIEARIRREYALKLSDAQARAEDAQARAEDAQARAEDAQARADRAEKALEAVQVLYPSDDKIPISSLLLADAARVMEDHFRDSFRAITRLTNSAMSYVDRAGIQSTIVNVIKARLEVPRDVIMKFTSHRMIFKFPYGLVGPGGGKSRELDEAAISLPDSLESQIQDVKPFVINISFNGMTSFCDAERYTENEANEMFVVTRRLLYQVYANAGLDCLEIKRNFLKIEIEFFDFMKLIFNFGYNCVIIGIDEINKINCGKFLKSLLNSILVQSLEISTIIPNFICLPIICGTVLRKGRTIAHDSNFGYIPLPFPLMSFNESVAAIWNVPELDKYRSVPGFQEGLFSCLVEIGGHCRSLEVLIKHIGSRAFHIDGIPEANIDSWRGAMDAIDKNLSEFYALAPVATDLCKAISFTVLGVQQRESLDNSQIVRLIEVGLVRQNFDNRGNFAVPPIIIRHMASQDTPIAHRWPAARANDFRSWEILSERFFLFRLICFDLLNIRVTTLREIFPGTWSQTANASIRVHIPTTVQWVKAPGKYENIANNLKINVLYDSVYGDIFDSFMLLEKVDGGTVFVCMQMKWTRWGDTDITNEILLKELIKINKLIEIHQKCFIFPIMSNRDMNSTCTPTAGQMVIVNDEEYYGSYIVHYLRGYIKKLIPIY